MFDSDFHALDPRARARGELPKVAPLTVGDDVFIGARATILKGVTIGDGAVVASGSVVTRSIPSYCVAAGVPARVVTHLRNDDPA